MQALGTDFTIATPAFPDNKRTVFKGYLFVGDVLLNESGMQNHPLTPMTDPNLVRVLQAQTPSRVGLIDHSVVAQGEAAIRTRIDQLKAEGVRMAVVDAVSNADLLRLGPALRACRWSPRARAWPWPAGQLWRGPCNEAARPACPAQGLQAIVSGSCSVATNQQVMDFIKAGKPALAIDPLRIAAGVDVAAEALAWAEGHIGQGPVLVYSTAEPSAVRAIQGKLGSGKSRCHGGETIAAIARGLVQRVCASSSWRVAKPPAPACRPWASRKCALARRLTRRAVVPCRGARRQGRAAHHAQVGQFRQHRLFTKAFAQLQA